MSKAFTKEDSGGAEDLLPPRPRSTSGEKRYITPEGYRALQEELATLSTPDSGGEGLTALEGEVRSRERARRVRQLAATLEEVCAPPSAAASAGAILKTPESALRFTPPSICQKRTSSAHFYERATLPRVVVSPRPRTQKG